MKQRVFFISGLGADKRIFSWLNLSFCDPVFVDWLPPLPKESLESYALRMRAEIKDPNPYIVGLSFGGMLVSEMARHDDSVRGMLLASNVVSTQLPFFLRIGKYLPVYRLFPGQSIKKFAFVAGLFLGFRGAEQKKVFREIVKSTDSMFTRWAMDAIVHWDQRKRPANLVQIHGSADRLLPLRKVQADVVIRGGTHVLPISHPVEISNMIHDWLEKTRDSAGQSDNSSTRR